VMRTAAEVDGCALGKRRAARCDGRPCRMSCTPDQLGRPGQADTPDLFSDSLPWIKRRRYSGVCTRRISSSVAAAGNDVLRPEQAALSHPLGQQNDTLVPFVVIDEEALHAGHADAHTHAPRSGAEAILASLRTWIWQRSWKREVTPRCSLRGFSE